MGRDDTGYLIYGDALAAADALDGTVDGKIKASLLESANGGDAGIGFAMANVAGTNGYTASISASGDYNGDGLDDIVMGNADGDTIDGTDAGQVFMVFGRTNNPGPDVDLSTPNGTSIVRFDGVVAGAHAGYVSNAGDINGDGLDDMMIGSASLNEGYVVFGKSDWSSTPVIDLAALNGTDGFAVTTGISSSSVYMHEIGDVDGDGFADIGIADPTTDSGYILFGGEEWTATVDLTTMSGEQGFSIDQRDGFNAAGADINGDGFSDIIAASRDDDQIYVVYGGDITGDINASSSDGADNLVGTWDADKIDGQGGADIIHAGAGNDVVTVSDDTFQRLDGGGGFDTLFLDGGFDIDFTTLSENIITGFEKLNFDNGLANTLDIDFASVLDIGEAIDNLLGEGNTLIVAVDEFDTVNLIGNWTERETVEGDPQQGTSGYSVYDSDDSNATVVVQQSMNLNGPA